MILCSIALIQIFLFLVVFSCPFSYIKGFLNMKIILHLSMKIILLDPNLMRTFFGSFFDPNYGTHP